MSSLNDKEFGSYTRAGSDDGASNNEWAQRVTLNTGTTIKNISGETITLSAGAAGTTGVTNTASGPILDSSKTRVGDAGDTSFAFVAGTVLTTEVAYNYDQNDATQLAAMSNGEFAIDYHTGRMRYKKATTATSDTANYSLKMAVVDTEMNKPTVTSATGSGAINTTTTISDHFKLNSVTVHFDTAPTTSEDLTVTIDANDGAVYDTVLYSVDPSVGSSIDIVYLPEKDILLESGDEIKVAYPNTDTKTYGLRIVTEKL
jgi:hypothetical protein